MIRVGLYIISVSVFFASCTKVQKQPNLIVIYTDDQRTQTLSCYDNDCPIETPNIDRLATHGIRFTQGAVVAPICGVSRACLLPAENQKGVSKDSQWAPYEYNND